MCVCVCVCVCVSVCVCVCVSVCVLASSLYGARVGPKYHCEKLLQPCFTTWGPVRALIWCLPVPHLHRRGPSIPCMSILELDLSRLGPNWLHHQSIWLNTTVCRPEAQVHIKKKMKKTPQPTKQKTRQYIDTDTPVPPFP